MASDETVVDDLPLASYLVAHGHPLLRLEGEPKRHRTFIFGPVPQALIDSFYSGGSAPAMAMTAAFRTLRRQIGRQDGERL